MGEGPKAEARVAGRGEEEREWEGWKRGGRGRGREGEEEVEEGSVSWLKDLLVAGFCFRQREAWGCGAGSRSRGRRQLVREMGWGGMCE